MKRKTQQYLQTRAPIGLGPSETGSGLIVSGSVLVFLVLSAYSAALDGSFHFDDQAIFLDPYIMAPNFGVKIFRLMQTRPLTFFTFHLNYLATARPPGAFTSSTCSCTPVTASWSY